MNDDEWFFQQVPRERFLYKIISLDNFLSSIRENYLYFNRVDSYKDFKQADPYDSVPLSLDEEVNKKSFFENRPELNINDYYHSIRNKTYACCFSIENSKNILKEYGDICVRFKSSYLLNKIEELNKPDEKIDKILTYNYVNYMNFDLDKLNKIYTENIFRYLFVKRNDFFKEKEFRVALSFCKPEDCNNTFYKLYFNFKEALENKSMIILSKHKSAIIKEIYLR